MNWREVEELVAWVEAIDHPSAKVKHNAILPDAETGEARQVDVLIEFREGRVQCLVIGEVRHRTRVAGSQWVEEVWGKMKSVGATGAFMASTSGFSKPALTKAAARGIQTVSIHDGEAVAPSMRVEMMRIGTLARRFDLDLEPVDAYSGAAFDVHPEQRSKWASDLGAYQAGALVGELEQSGTSIGAIAAHAMRSCFGDLPVEARNSEGVHKLATEVVLPRRVRMKAADGSRRRVKAVRARVRVTQEVVEYPLTVFGYGDQDFDRARMVATGRVEQHGLPFHVRLLFPRPSGLIKAGESVSLLVEPLSERARRFYRGHRLVWANSESAGQPSGQSDTSGPVPSDFNIVIDLDPTGESRPLVV